MARGPCHHGITRPQVADGERIERLAAGMLDNSRGEPKGRGSPVLVRRGAPRGKK
jgi:hypothetical protein